MEASADGVKLLGTPEKLKETDGVFVARRLLSLKVTLRVHLMF